MVLGPGRSFGAVFFLFLFFVRFRLTQFPAYFISSADISFWFVCFRYCSENAL